MASRRSTRNTGSIASRATPVAPPTPASGRRSARKAGGTDLPAISSRPSTAYGTNTLAIPDPAATRVVNSSVNDVLNELLERPDSPTPPTRANAIPPSASASRRSAGRTSAAHAARAAATTASTAVSSMGNRSFNDESNIFGNARIDSSSLEEEDGIVYPDQMVESINAHRAATIQIANSNMSQPRYQSSIPTRSVPHKIGSFFAGFLPSGCMSIALLILGLAAYLAYFLCTRSPLPPSIVRPSPPSTSPPHQHVDEQYIYGRLDALEYDVKTIKKQMSTIDFETIEILRGILPEHLVVVRDSSGELSLSDDFWHALQDKIRSDGTLFPDQPSTKDPASWTKKEMGKIWEKYLLQNERAVNTYLAKTVKENFPRLLQNHQVATKDSVLDMIRKNWQENEAGIKSELKRLNKKLDDNITRSRGGLAEKEIIGFVEDTIRKFISAAQLEAMVSAALTANINYGLSRVNHFSPGTGAMINPLITSPTYVNPINKVHYFPWRFIRSLVGVPVPTPNGPRAALTPWQEFGDCWCHPTAGVLAVVMGSTIYPKEVVVEHISQSASLEPDATPKDMELWAHMPDGKFREMWYLSAAVFPEMKSDLGIPAQYVLIAEWTYDINARNKVQAFPINKLDMEGLEADTNKLIVRAKNNWSENGTLPYTCFYRVRVHGQVVKTPGTY